MYKTIVAVGHNISNRLITSSKFLHIKDQNVPIAEIFEHLKRYQAFQSAINHHVQACQFSELVLVKALTGCSVLGMLPGP